MTKLLQTTPTGETTWITALYCAEWKWFMEMFELETILGWIPEPEGVEEQYETRSNGVAVASKPRVDAAIQTSMDISTEQETSR
jgi:hypothetical protein